ncbi:ribonuclease P protein component [Candidatus Kuenenbacteria bacterium HGW-Kuenenbacteria-1]|uniref:Ribonuclease P protein component n=1 Tax=Candidatus Kuenenbacteria bacterium HGW-Kuenenbacteria-1 TaxID=2013812 RepID=A0A2N1UMW5_9BACT|nr:MAG: ribonuclease P protein component [Candidatus Kuenenbacteria bacterium HGW-Kuenenbacteria-1]
MLPKQYRLTKDRDFKFIFRKGRNCFKGEFGIKFLKNNLDVSRFGFVVSNKIAKKANKRNLIKRRLREIIRKNLSNIEVGLDVMIMARLEIKKLNFFELKEKLERTLWQIRILN